MSSLPQDLTDDLLECLRRSQLTGTFCSDEDTPDAVIISELLRNQSCMMRVLAAMNDAGHFSKAGRELFRHIPSGEDKPDRATVYDVLQNQLCIMSVLAAMNGLPHDPKAVRELIYERRAKEFAERAETAGMQWDSPAECWIDGDGNQFDRNGERR